jgi:uroporphyrinogen decarboxylase
MQFIPDYRNFEAVMRKQRPSRLPLYEHVVSPAIMEQMMNIRFAELEEGNTRDHTEYFRRNCRFFGAMT